MRAIEITLTYTEEEAREVARAILYFTSNVSATHEDHDRMALIRSVIKGALPPPKPEEPTGLGAVVEDDLGNLWIRRGPTHYVAAEGSSSGFYNNAQTWGELTVVRVLSDGVQP